MTFEKWITKWCECVKFEDTEHHFDDLVLDGLILGDDILSYMEQAFTAGVRSQKEQTND